MRSATNQSGIDPVKVVDMNHPDLLTNDPSAEIATVRPDSHDAINSGPPGLMGISEREITGVKCGLVD